MLRIEPPALDVRQLTKTFRANRALSELSFTVELGERLALLGPNGAGKTSLIRLIAGLTRPDSGTILMGGLPIELEGVRAGLGVIPQEIALYADLTASENLYAFGRFHGLRSKQLQQRVQWALEWTGLADRAHQLAKTFSGGMKRRINIACSVLHEPQLLLLDEPTVGVDPQSRERIFAMLDELQREGAAILLTTHHLDEAQSIADRIVIIDRGQLVANGSFTQLVERTIGSSRWVTVRLDRPMVSSDWPVHLQFQPQVLRASDAHSPNNITVRISDLSRQLPEFLSEMSKAGYQVHDLQIESPSLHHVFMHLTGRSLRD